jgi:uncharacterized protein (DUF2147 family)
MRRTAILGAILVLTMAGVAYADDGDAIIGLWATDPESDEGQAHVEISKLDGAYVGKIVWLEEPVYPPDDDGGMAGEKKVDRENPDPDLRNRPVVGLEMLHGFVYAGDNQWKKGRIYDPEKGKTYKSKMKLDDNGVLKIRGYVGISAIGRTTEWTRVQK